MASRLGFTNSVVLGVRRLSSDASAEPVFRRRVWQIIDKV
jgi:hypothetical protein